MYKIIGNDQQEYGPVSSEQIQQWIALGRANAQTKAQADGGPWKTLGDFPEFATALRAGALPPGPPPLTGVTQPPAPKTSGLAIASLVLGILGLVTCGFTALIGLVLGIAALNQTRKSNGTLGGSGIALAGTIVSAAFLLFAIPMGAAIFLPAFARAKDRAMTVQCLNNMRQLSLAARLYANDHKENLPSAAHWCDDLKEYVGNNDRVFKCSAAKSSGGCDYAYNSQVAGLEIKNVDPQTVLFFETENGWNRSGGTGSVLSLPRHRSRARQKIISVAFVDGHVEEVPADQIAALRWNP